MEQTQFDEKMQDFKNAPMMQEQQPSMMGRNNTPIETQDAHEPNMIVPQGENPFAMEQYNDINMPDQPITYGANMADKLLSDDEVPEEYRKKFWYVFHKDNVLAFLDEKRKNNKLLNLDIAKIDELNCTPYYDYNFEKEMEYGVIRNIFETKLDRAVGIKGGNVKNERIMLQSQFSESRNINDNGEQGMIRESFFKRLLGRRS